MLLLYIIFSNLIVLTLGIFIIRFHKHNIKLQNMLKSQTKQSDLIIKHSRTLAKKAIEIIENKYVTNGDIVIFVQNAQNKLTPLKLNYEKLKMIHLEYLNKEKSIKQISIEQNIPLAITEHLICNFIQIKEMKNE